MAKCVLLILILFIYLFMKYNSPCPQAMLNLAYVYPQWY